MYILEYARVRIQKVLSYEISQITKVETFRAVNYLHDCS